ncbi:helix-turn-helix domain-containing protein [Sphingobium yanoikuyae]|uniref:helix-turn-helix domain-containing protein n=1 Tax=Sphingobium yanoikuyae TaxID=13690 RepID=UPI0022DD0DFC|nr:helix-turn-helix transcriptional regulator [Sphingobium yanoikuyae]WBQ19299.1 helix-turn-helix transcriptional regulator [Sphingobium yanoikuyae]
MAKKNAIGGRIKALRKAKLWQQKLLTRMVGIRFERIYKYVGGFNTPPIDVLVKFADAFDTTVDYLVTEMP